MSTHSFGPIRQIAWVVRDLEASVANWLRISGVGPWTCFRNVAMTGVLRGEPAKVRMHVALGYQGDMEIELIEDLGHGPSPYRSAAGVPLIGMQLCFAAANEVTRVAYLEDPLEPGLLLEFIEMNAMMREGFSARLAAARSWQGGEALQVIDLGG
jgi:hypothetical protein